MGLRHKKEVSFMSTIVHNKPSMRWVRLTVVNQYFLDVIFFFNDTATTEIYTLSLHDALPICNEK